MDGQRARPAALRYGNGAVFRRVRHRYPRDDLSCRRICRSTGRTIRRRCLCRSVFPRLLKTSRIPGRSTLPGRRGRSRSRSSTEDVPAGLSIDGGGNLSGSPTEAGSFTFNVRAYDSQPTPKQAIATISMSVVDVQSGSLFSKNILLVNGVDWGTYTSDINSAYEAKAFLGQRHDRFLGLFRLYRNVSLDTPGAKRNRSRADRHTPRIFHASSGSATITAAISRCGIIRMYSNMYSSAAT